MLTLTLLALGWAVLFIIDCILYTPTVSFAFKPVRWNKWVLYIYIGCWAVNGLIREPALSLCFVYRADSNALLQQPMTP